MEFGMQGKETRDIPSIPQAVLASHYKTVQLNLYWYLEVKYAYSVECFHISNSCEMSRYGDYILHMCDVTANIGGGEV